MVCQPPYDFFQPILQLKASNQKEYLIDFRNFFLFDPSTVKLSKFSPIAFIDNEDLSRWDIYDINKLTTSFVKENKIVKLRVREADFETERPLFGDGAEIEFKLK